MNHTKGKWRLLPGRNLHYVNKVVGRDYEATMQKCFYICGYRSESDFIADVITKKSAEGKANARRICQCVNNFDELLKALKLAHSQICRLANSATWTNDDDINLDGIVEAIAKAGAK